MGLVLLEAFLPAAYQLEMEMYAHRLFLHSRTWVNYLVYLVSKTEIEFISIEMRRDLGTFL